jgi:hypothetical protein
MNFEDAWSSRRTRRLAAAHLRATGPKARSCTAPRVTPHGHPGLRPSLREMFGAVVSGIARHVRLPMKKDSASPIGQSPLPPRLEPETTKPKIGWKMKNVSRSTVPVRLLDFRGHRDVRGTMATMRLDTPDGDAEIHQLLLLKHDSSQSRRSEDCLTSRLVQGRCR